MQPPLDTAQREVLKLSETLLACQRELAQVREAQEPLQEQCSQLRAQSAKSDAIAAHLGQALADHLSRAFWEERQPTTPIRWPRFIGSRWPWLKTLFGSGRSATDLAVDQQIRLVESSRVFQSTWYLQQYPDVALAGINPASHYVHSGAQEGRDPGPEFSTCDYLARHPGIERSGTNPLVHYLQSPTAGNEA